MKQRDQINNKRYVNFSSNGCYFTDYVFKERRSKCPSKSNWMIGDFFHVIVLNSNDRQNHAFLTFLMKKMKRDEFKKRSAIFYEICRINYTEAFGASMKKKCSQKVLEQRSKLSEQEVFSSFLSSLIDDKICVHFFDDCKKSN